MHLTVNARVVLDDMRFAHQVLDESSHLGLDEESAARIGAVLRRRIAALEVEVAEQVRGPYAAREPVFAFATEDQP